MKLGCSGLLFGIVVRGLLWVLVLGWVVIVICYDGFGGICYFVVVILLIKGGIGGLIWVCWSILLML